MQQTYKYDILIIGSGAAGLSLALQLPSSFRIAILSKNDITAGSTYNAQGGIAAVMDDANDSWTQHIKDTQTAGAGLCNEEAVRHIVKNGKRTIQWLISQGVPFTTKTTENSTPGQKYHLTQEGGHTTRRIIHAADATGRALSDTLIKKIRQAQHIDIFEHHLAIDLITTRYDTINKQHCYGAYVLNRNTGMIHTFSSRSTVLATGGASKSYLYTSNSDGSTGDGIAMAWRVGCRVANMEFNQFHPTCLYHPQAKSFLISEAVRGEGGKLIRKDGSRFMPEYDQRAELAPRDIVARAIDHEMKKLGVDCLFLDISHQSKAFLQSHFPMIYERCLSFGIDITRDPIPVVPAAHYTCGGVMVDRNAKTDLQNLYAIGECSFTGLHGANRLASNSLLECLVSAYSAAEAIQQQRDTHEPSPTPPPLWDESQVTDADEKVVISHNWDELRRFMWDYVGIVRTTKRLNRAAHRISLFAIRN